MVCTGLPACQRTGRRVQDSLTLRLGGWEGNQEGHAHGREKREHLGRAVSGGEHWWPVGLINDQWIGQGALPGGQAECAHCGRGREATEGQVSPGAGADIWERGKGGPAGGRAGTRGCVPGECARRPSERRFQGSLLVQRALFSSRVGCFGVGMEDEGQPTWQNASRSLGFRGRGAGV